MEVFAKILIVGLLFTVIYHLAKAGITMVKGDKKSRPMSHFIGRRLMFAFGLLIFIIALVGFGVIEPNGNPYQR